MNEQARHAHGHRHGGLGSGVMNHPRWFELVGVVVFLGQRRRSYAGLVDLAGVGPGNRVLDVGCGTGYFARRLARALGPTGRVLGIDPSAAMIAYARRGAPPQCEFRVGAAEHLDEPDASADAVTATLSFHHVDADARPTAVAEMLRVLRPGGRLLVVEPRPPRSVVVRKVVGLLGGGRTHGADTLAEATDLLTAAGATITDRGTRQPWLHYLVARPPG